MGLLLLLALSPCKVRNFIELQLGIPQTSVLNKSQTTITNSNCAELETSTFNTNPAKKHTKTLATITAGFQFVIRFIPTKKTDTNYQETSLHNVVNIPLYILYQQFKDYL